MSRVNSYGYGDHYLHVKIHVPTKLTEMQRSLIEAYAQTEIDRVGSVKLTSTPNNNNERDSESAPGNKSEATSGEDDETIMDKIKKKLF